MAAVSNVSNSRLAIVPVEGFGIEGNRCGCCLRRNKFDDKGQPLDLVGHAEHLDHVMHRKCLQVWLQTAVFLGGQTLESALKCFSCQSVLNVGNLYSEAEFDRFVQ